MTRVGAGGGLTGNTSAAWAAPAARRSSENRLESASLNRGVQGVSSHILGALTMSLLGESTNTPQKKTPKPKTKRQDLINIFHNKTQLVAKGPCSVPHQSPFTCQTSSPSHRNPRWMLYSLLGNVTVHFLYTTCFLEPAFKPRGHALLHLPIGEGTSASKER